MAHTLRGHYFHVFGVWMIFNPSARKKVLLGLSAGDVGVLRVFQDAEKHFTEIRNRV